MKIKSVRTTRHSCPFETKIFPYWDGIRIITKKDVMYTRITTDEGIAGYGEGNCMRMEEQYPLTKDIVGPAIVGEDPLDIEGIWKKVAKLLPDENRLNLAMSSIDIALHDILGKAAGKSVCELLGGKKRDKVRVYSSAGMYQSPQEYANEAAHFKSFGFKGYKYRPGMGPEKDIETIRLMREAVGDDFEIMIDAHTWARRQIGYTPAAVEAIAKVAEELDVYFLEMMYSSEDPYLYKRLKSVVPDLPLAGGEHLSTLAEFEEFLKVLDIIQTDPSLCGGFTFVKKVAEMAKAEGKQFIGHLWGTRLASLALAHLSATFTEKVVPWGEHPLFTTDKIRSMYPFPLAEEIFTKPLNVADSYIAIPKEPGLGKEIDEKALEKYSYIPGRWSTVYPPRSSVKSLSA